MRVPVITKVKKSFIWDSWQCKILELSYEKNKTEITISILQLSGDGEKSGINIPPFVKVIKAIANRSEINFFSVFVASFCSENGWDNYYKFLF